MFAFTAAALLITSSPQAVVQVPVEDPVLPTGTLAAVSATRDGGIYVDAGSVQISDLEGKVRGTVVLVTAGETPLRVITLWIDCVGHQYQVGSGRQYNLSGEQVALTRWEPYQQIPAGTGVAQTESVFCKAGGPDLSILPMVADWRAALAAR